MELSGRLQELQNEENCMNDSKDFQDAESARSGNSHVTNQPMLFPKHPIPRWIVEAFIRIAAPQRRTSKHTHGVLGNVFVNTHASSTILHPQELNYWSEAIEEPIHTSTTRKMKDQDKIEI